MNKMNMNIRGVNYLTEMFDKRTVFERKLRLREFHLGSNNVPHLASGGTEKLIVPRK
jgi:hypothetical protein